MENTQEREKHYWGYRIDVKNQDFFFKELEQGRLRQGWGYAENQKLPDTKDSGARKNLSMYHNVKKGDSFILTTDCSKYTLKGEMFLIGSYDR